MIQLTLNSLHQTATNARQGRFLLRFGGGGCYANLRISVRSREGRERRRLHRYRRLYAPRGRDCHKQIHKKPFLQEIRLNLGVVPFFFRVFA